MQAPTDPPPIAPPPLAPPLAPVPAPNDSIGLGVFCYIAAHIVIVVFFASLVGIIEMLKLPRANDLAQLLFIAALWLGFSSLLYQIPICIVLWRMGKRRATSAMLVCMGIAFLLTGICTAFFVFGF
jgi:hypothetical protein